MSDNGKDTMVVEDRVRTALSSQASTTVVSPDGWDAIEARVERRRRRRTFVWAVGGPAVALAGVALLVAVLPVGDEKPSVVAGPGAGGPVRYAPVGMGLPEEGYSLQGVETGGSTEVAANASTVRVYGHRAADGVRLDQILLVITPRSQEDVGQLRAVIPGQAGEQCAAPDCAGLPSTEATLRGQQMVVVKGPLASKVVWDEPGGPTLGVMETGMGEDDLYAVVNNVRLENGLATAGALPAGFFEVHAGVWPPLPRRLSLDFVAQRWVKGSPGGDEFSLEVHQGPGVSLDTRAWIIPDAVLSSVHDLPALYSATEGSLTWSPSPGVVLAVVGTGHDEGRLRTFAQSVQPLSEEAWEELAGGSPVVSPPIPTDEPPAGPEVTLASGEVAGQEWTLTHQASSIGASGCLSVELASGLAGLCDLKLAGPNQVGTPYVIGNVSTDPEPIFMIATVGDGVSGVRVEWSDGITERTDDQSARTGARLVDPKGALPSRLVIIPVPDWSKNRPTSLTALNGASDLNRQVVPERLLPPVPVTTMPLSPTTAG